MIKARDLVNYLDQDKVILSAMEPPYYYYHIEVESNKNNTNIVAQNLEVESVDTL